MSGSGYVTLANLDFENELSGAVRALPAGFLKRWRWIMRLLPGMKEAECLPPGRELSAQGPARALVVWGVTPRTAQLAESLGLGQDFPAPEVVRRVNDKRFSHQLEQKLGIGLPGSRLVCGQESLQRAVRDCPHDWVLKHPLGFSGRERVLGKRGLISESAAGWARRKWSQGWTLLFEPWVEERHDASYHFDISREGGVKFLGFTRMLEDPSGVYRGSRTGPEETPDPQTLDCLLQVASELAAQGYWGPVGMDSLNGRLGSQDCRRALVEINARTSFGRLALALRDWLPPLCTYTWHHPKERLASTPPPLPPRDRVESGLYSLPLEADPEGISGTFLEVSLPFREDALTECSG